METLINRSMEPPTDLGIQVSIEMPSQALPLTIYAAADINCMEWAMTYKNKLNLLLLNHGAMLLRGFNIVGATAFNQLFSLICGDPIEYRNRTSPRDQVYNNIYTSTSHPKDQFIQMHTENSYSEVFNRIISFYCLTPPSEGGETP